MKLDSIFISTFPDKLVLKGIVTVFCIQRGCPEMMCIISDFILNEYKISPIFTDCPEVIYFRNTLH